MGALQTLSLSFLFIQFSYAFQVDTISFPWKNLIKEHKTIDTVYDEYIDAFHASLYHSPQIILDTIVVLNPGNKNVVLTPLEGNNTIVGFITYPEIARRAGVEGNVVLSATITQSGSLWNMDVHYSNAELFNSPVIAALQKVQFEPVIIDGKTKEVQVAIALSFLLKKKVNVQIEEMTFSRGSCLGACPSYTITFRNGESATFEGTYNVKKMGVWIADVKPADLEGIKALLFQMDFFNMKEAYTANITDLPTISISIKTGKETKTVSTNYFKPLWEVILLVDFITEKLDWQKIDD